MKYHADPMSMFKVMNKVKPFDDQEQMRLNLPVRIAFESMRSGKGEEGDFHTVAAAINVALVCAEKIDPMVEETAIRGRDALLRCLERYKRTGRWGFDGPALADITTAIDLHEQLVANHTPLQMQAAMTEVIKRMERGQVEKGNA